MPANIEKFIERLKSTPKYSEVIVHHEVLRQRWPSHSSPVPPLPHQLQHYLESAGISSLYSHQAEALSKARSGDNFVVITPTASGKTLCYNLPVLESALADPKIRAIYLFPLKALEQDQMKALGQALEHLEGMGGKLRAAIYDGDTSDYARKKIRAELPNILMTNPDMLHLAFLPYHPSWETLFRQLRYVVLDEVHTYRGVFGSHIAQVLRRFRRVCEFYGSRPQFIACSATISNAREFCERLVGEPFGLVEQSGAPRAEGHFIFLNPDESPYALASHLFRDCIRAGLKTIAFTKARKITELMHTWVLKAEPWLAARVSSYRAGFLPEERRQIEARLFRGELQGVISTSALEVGIDIGGLDICILVGYPGTITATWQRGGRVGRGKSASVVFLIAQPDALDQYFMKHPADFFQRGFEAAALDPNNEQILKEHLPCAAAEIPLRESGLFLTDSRCYPLLRELEANGKLLQSAAGDEWYSAARYPQRAVDIRSVGQAYAIIDEADGTPIGTISGPRVFSECHQKAIYLHRAKQYLVTKLDLERRIVKAKATTLDYYTKPISDKNTEILEVRSSKTMAGFRVNCGRLRVEEKIRGYEKRRTLGGELLGYGPLSLPPYIFETIGIWIEIDDEIKNGARRRGMNFMGGIHALEHAAISIFPLFALCDRNDIGGISFPEHPQVARGAVFIYDGYPGGIGLAERAYQIMDELLRFTLAAVEECPCEEGCPSCIHSPKCGSGNKPLDKRCAIFVLEELLMKRGGRPRAIDEAGLSPIKRRMATIQKGKITTPSSPLRILYFDLETQRTAEEVGGWQNKHLMGLSLAVIYDGLAGQYLSFTERQVSELLKRLKAADLVIGFNIIGFDYQVLSRYCQFDLPEIRTFDLMCYIQSKLGRRLSLNNLAKHTLGAQKLADGIQAVKWFKEGKMEQLKIYCEKDVEITKGLFEYGIKNGHLLYENRDGAIVRLPVEWDLADIVSAR